MDPVVHFEMPYDDAARVTAFYRSAFGWNTETTGAEMGHYVLATTTASDAKGPTTPGAINGGLFKRSADKPAQFPSVVIAVQDLRFVPPPGLAPPRTRSPAFGRVAARER